MKSEIYIYHHLGLGDHLMCFGLVIELSKKYSKVNLFCKYIYYESVNFLYKDEKNIVVVPVDEPNIGSFLKQNNLDYFKDVLRIGFEKYAELKTIMSPDESFYLTNNVDFNKKYENFYINRNLEQEEILFNKYGVKEGEYIFVHDDRERGYNIEIYGQNVVRPNFLLTQNIFDYLLLIEKSKEIHCMDSCFFIMIDLLLNHSKMFYHINTRGDYSIMFPTQEKGEFGHPKYQKNWQIIK